MNALGFGLPGVCFAAILIMLSSAKAWAASGDYLIDVWRGESGLPSSSVTAIAQTPDGYLWVGTYNGLARFDGVRFVKFDPDNTPQLKRARVRKLFVDESGTLWINTYDGSLTSFRDGDFTLEWNGDGSLDSTALMVSGRSNNVVFMLHTGELIKQAAKGHVAGVMGEGRAQPAGRRRAGDLPSQQGYGNAGRAPYRVSSNDWQVLRPPGASSGSISAEDGSGVLWGRGRDQKLWRYRQGSFELMPPNSGLQGTVINCLLADPKGQIWIGTEKEVAKWSGNHFEIMTPTNGEPALNVSWIYLAPNGDEWIVANGHVRKAQGRQWIFEAERCAGLFAGYQDRLGMQEDRNGAVWLYHYGRGLFHIRRDGQTRQLDLEDNFPGDRVDCFYEDVEGNLWTGVDRGGLVRLRQKRFVALMPHDSRVVASSTRPEDQGGERTAVKAAVSVAEDAQGAIWIGTYGGGLHRLWEGEWQTFSVPGGRRSFVFSVCPGATDSLWVSAGEEDLFLKSRDQFQLMNPAVHGVKVLLAGSDGRVWIGNKSGLWSWSNGQLRLFRAEDGIRRTDVRALAEDSGGAIWAGAGDGRLYQIVSNRVESFQAADALAGQPIWALHAEQDGTIWAGTFRGGLLRFQNRRFTRYTTKDGLPDDVICQILEDGNRRLWIGSQQGIFSVAIDGLDAYGADRSKSLNCIAYGKYDGLPSLECSGGYQPAAWRTKDGRLLFTTLGGVVSVQPDEMAPNRLPPPVVIEEILVDGQDQTPNSKLQTPKPGNTGLVSVLEVPPGKRQVEFRYTGLSFVSPDRVRFRYKLEPLDKAYIDAGTRRYAQYSFLRPGQYTFHVLACNNDGVWNEGSAAVALNVQPYFYETWSFRLTAAALALGVLVAAVRQVAVRRMQRKLRAAERQQAIERDRARIAQDIHDDLGAGLTQIMLLSELAQREPRPETQNHLGQISDMARGLTRAMDEIVWAVDPQHDTLGGFMDYASAYTEEFLRVAGLRCRMDLPASLPDWPMDAELRYNLFLALKEALNNIVKHAHATEVRLELRLEKEAFTLAVQDNGKGLSRDEAGDALIRKGGKAADEAEAEKEKHAAVSASSGRAEAEALSQNGQGNGDRIVTGHGLHNLENRLRSVGGECIILSQNGNGTRIEMTMRMKSSVSPVVVIGNGTPGER